MKAVLPVDQTSAPEIEFSHSVIMVFVNKTYKEGDDLYLAAQQAWKVSLKRARDCDYVLAIFNRVVIGVYAAKEWLPARREHFPQRDEPDNDGLSGFIGAPAPEDIQQIYMHRRMPDGMRSYGTQFMYGPPM